MMSFMMIMCLRVPIAVVMQSISSFMFLMFIGATGHDYLYQRYHVPCRVSKFIVVFALKMMMTMTMLLRLIMMAMEMVLMLATMILMMVVSDVLLFFPYLSAVALTCRISGEGLSVFRAESFGIKPRDPSVQD